MTTCNCRGGDDCCMRAKPGPIVDVLQSMLLPPPPLLIDALPEGARDTIMSLWVIDQHMLDEVQERRYRPSPRPLRPEDV